MSMVISWKRRVLELAVCWNFYKAIASLPSITVKHLHETDFMIRRGQSNSRNQGPGMTYGLPLFLSISVPYLDNSAYIHAIMSLMMALHRTEMALGEHPSIRHQGH